MTKFTFKKDAPATGLASMFDYGSGEIKLNGKICGFYQGKSYDRFEAWFSVKDESASCGWRNAKLKKEFTNEPELRTWLKEHTEDICKALKLHFRDHTGPETRTMAAHPEQLHQAYLDNLKKILADAVKELKEFRECTPYFYSCQCDENRNRRYTSGDNHATFTPYRRDVVPGCTGFADKELGCLYLFDVETKLPVYTVGNYAAHPLAGHAPGLGGLRISADFPGVFRNYVESNTGAETMFISGACGDLVPKEDELGLDAVEKAGKHLAKEAIGGMLEARRNPLRYELKDAKVGILSKYFTVPLRKKYANQANRLPEEYMGKEEVSLEIQCISIGDICFVGIPGELTTELGQEIKWHSPFRRTFIAYNATAYFSYMVPANFMVAGGYEALSQRFTSRGGLKLVQTASDALFELRESLYPSGEETYPDNCSDDMVTILPNR